MVLMLKHFWTYLGDNARIKKAVTANSPLYEKVNAPQTPGPQGGDIQFAHVWSKGKGGEVLAEEGSNKLKPTRRLDIYLR